MPFAYYQRLGRREQAIYRRSDAVGALPVPGVRALHPVVEALRAALLAGDGRAVARASAAVAGGISLALGADPPRLQVLSTRPRGDSHELHGLYVPAGEAPPVIRVWMRTARQQRVVAFRTFLRTLLHEVVHHLDFEVLGLEWSFHTEGFFKRESSLFHQLVTDAQPPGRSGDRLPHVGGPRAHRLDMDPSEKGKGRGEGGGEASARRQEIGPSGGPPDDRERQRRGATQTEDVMEEKLRQGAPQPAPKGTGESGELGEPDPGIGDAPDLE